jgi:hypothetical protein
MPAYGVWYRSGMRSAFTALVIVVQAISMICGFYDLYRNIPYIQPVLAAIYSPIYGWVVVPLYHLHDIIIMARTLD